MNNREQNNLVTTMLVVLLRWAHSENPIRMDAVLKELKQKALIDFDPEVIEALDVVKEAIYD